MEDQILEAIRQDSPDEIIKLFVVLATAKQRYPNLTKDVTNPEGLAELEVL